MPKLMVVPALLVACAPESVEDTAFVDDKAALAYALVEVTPSLAPDDPAWLTFVPTAVSTTGLVAFALSNGSQDALIVDTLTGESLRIAKRADHTGWVSVPRLRGDTYLLHRYVDAGTNSAIGYVGTFPDDAALVPGTTEAAHPVVHDLDGQLNLGGKTDMCWPSARLWTSTGTPLIADDTGADTVITAMNDVGDVTGTGSDGPWVQEATDARVVLPALPPEYGADPSGYETPVRPIEMTDGDRILANAVAWASDWTWVERPVVYEKVGGAWAATLLSLPTGTTSCHANGMNKNGVVVGTCDVGTTHTGSVAARWTRRGNGVSLLPTAGLPAARTGTYAMGIDDAGDIVVATYHTTAPPVRTFVLRPTL